MSRQRSQTEHRSVSASRRHYGEALPPQNHENLIPRAPPTPFPRIGEKCGLLPVGLYSVTTQAEGFQVNRRTDVRLNVNQTLRVNFEMVIGEVTETIEVQATAAAIDTETSSVGHVVSQKQVTQLPLNGRSFLQLLFLGNGAVETNGEQGTMRKDAGNAISINGARPTSNNFLLDGTSNTDTALGTPAAILSIDAIQEFKEQTATYSAEYGFSANQINIVSKTGINDMHGTLFHFLRNDALDANQFSTTSRARQRTFCGRTSLVSSPAVRL